MVKKVFVADFETTVYAGQKNTEVWAAALVELNTENVIIDTSIEAHFQTIRNQKGNILVYYHNLKFDGSFWLDYLLNNSNFSQAIDANKQFCTDKEMPNNSYKYSISNRGQWYTIIIRVDNRFIEIRDSLKLLPFSVRRIGDSFGTKHKKLDMEYNGFRHAGGVITEEERRYISNDVLVVKEALEIMFSQGHNKITIGACCLSEFKKDYCVGDDTSEWDKYFPNLYEEEIDFESYGAHTAGEYIRRSYRGGWCYVVKGKENMLKYNGTTADVNSLYPSMMSSESGNKYPVGSPYFWYGNYIPEEALEKDSYYFIRFRTRFYIKHNKLPFVQIKGNLLYKGTECLETSDIYNEQDGKYYDNYINLEGVRTSAYVILTMTETDFKLFKEHYDLVDFEILDGCYFHAEIGIFDKYINKYKKIKMENKGAIRELAKLFLNNLYGKMASSTDSSYKIAFIDSDNSLKFEDVKDNSKLPGYIAAGSAITSYSRCFTIRAAQANYYGIENPGFIYADTDSIHCDLTPEQIKGIRVDDKNFCCWKLESCWDVGLFVRQKTYVEHVVKENLKECEPYYNIKCAGMPETSKKLFIASIQRPKRKKITGVSGKIKKIRRKKTETEMFTHKHRSLTDFKIGLCVPGKLLPKRIPGGTLLVETTYQMR